MSSVQRSKVVPTVTLWILVLPGKYHKRRGATETVFWVLSVRVKGNSEKKYAQPQIKHHLFFPAPGSIWTLAVDLRIISSLTERGQAVKGSHRHVIKRTPIAAAPRCPPSARDFLFNRISWGWRASWLIIVWSVKYSPDSGLLWHFQWKCVNRDAASTNTPKKGNHSGGTAGTHHSAGTTLTTKYKHPRWSSPNWWIWSPDRI